MHKIIANKKGFEVSINFIVMLILGLAIFGVGIYFAGTIFKQTTEIGKELDAQTKSQIESKLRYPSALVAIGINRKEIPRGEHDTFGLGVANRDTTSGDFIAKIVCAFGQDKEGQQITDVDCETCCNKWIMAKETDMGAKQIDIGKLAPNEFKVPAVFFKIHKAAKSGSYVFNVQVYKKEEGQPEKPYDSVKKIYVDVP